MTAPPWWIESRPETLTFNVTWSGDDANGIGLDSYDVQYREGADGTWTDWLLETRTAGAPFHGEISHTYYFQCRARDLLGNLEDYPGGDGDTVTHTPLYAIPGYILGNRDQAVALAQIGVILDRNPEQFRPPSLGKALSGLDGSFNLYFNLSGVATLTVTRSSFGPLPVMYNIPITNPPTITFYLPPLDDRVDDGGLEAGDLSAWQLLNGEINPVLSFSSTAHTGDWAVLLGGIVPLPQVTPTLPFSVSATLTATGGTLTSTIATLLVPPGAVSGTVQLTLTGVPTVTGLPTGTQDVGPHLHWTAGLSDGTLLGPFSLTLFYEDAAWQAAQVAQEASLVLWQYDPLSATWVPLDGTLDALSNTITITTTEPGLLALLGTPHSGPWYSRLEQQLVLTPTPISGTLSLLYHVVGTATSSDTLHVTLAGPTTTLSATLPLTVSGWVHRWWSLPAGLGPTATLQIEWEQGERERPAIVILDEISLGSAVTGGHYIYLPLVWNR